jgi:hypothetical protein
MIGFSPREQNLFLPQVKWQRQLCKNDKDYCDILLWNSLNQNQNN